MNLTSKYHIIKISNVIKVFGNEEHFKNILRKNFGDNIGFFNSSYDNLFVIVPYTLISVKVIIEWCNENGIEVVRTFLHQGFDQAPIFMIYVK